MGIKTNEQQEGAALTTHEKSDVEATRKELIGSREREPNRIVFNAKKMNVLKANSLKDDKSSSKKSLNDANQSLMWNMMSKIG